MAGDPSADQQWQRVVAELRAHREAQQSAWGDVDDVTLARYLAGECSREERIQRLFDLYGRYPQALMEEATWRLAKRLGGERTKQALQHIKNNEIKQAISIVLEYYDQAYLHGCEKRGLPCIKKYLLSDPLLIDNLKTISK